MRDVTIIAHSARRVALRTVAFDPLPPLLVVVLVVVVVSLALDTRTTYAADDSSLLFQASRGSGSAAESTDASRWTLSRAIVQSPAEIISASVQVNRLSLDVPRLRDTSDVIISIKKALNKLKRVYYQ